MPKFQKKPVVIEAMHYTSADDVDSILDWMGDPTEGAVYEKGELTIVTLEGEMRASLGDWIIRGVQGEFYPCKPDIFEQTYQPVQKVEAATEGVESTAQPGRSEAEIKAEALEELSQKMREDRHTLTGRRRANADWFADSAWYAAEEIRNQQWVADRRARAAARVAGTTEEGDQ